MHRFLLAPSVIAFSLCSFAAKPTTGQSIRLAVDLTDAPRNIFHSSLTLPATTGEVTFVYPKWIPGNHRPSGPIANVAGLHFKAGSQELSWHRDPIEMYSFHVTVPPGVKEMVSLRIDRDVLDFFQEAGPGWQDRINAALRKAAGK